ncbi:MAG TPA: hypothetical protein P5137_15895 [Candidatus Brocadiia bacterium]|nr:hypothetical protein [Candidatus Brocadiia bacterium]
MLAVSLEFTACVLLMAATALAVAESVVTAIAVRRRAAARVAPRPFGPMK